MLSSIHPLGERARHNRWGLTVTSFVVGATGAGALGGSALGWIGSLLPTGDWRLGLAVSVVLVAGVADLARVTPPGVKRQVNEDWIGAFRGWVYGVGFGIQLGLGIATFVVTWGVYAVFALAVLTGDPLAGAIVGGSFGLGRSAFPLAAGWIDRPSRLTAFNRAMTDAARPVARIVGTGFVIVALAGGALRLM
ncbi:MAG TPA: hypothetical protein VHL52_13485 [Acidimicrobiia bacterium]|nr:hypothetical protein [Acidimicrobiia bacterium]